MVLNINLQIFQGKVGGGGGGDGVGVGVFFVASILITNS